MGILDLPGPQFLGVFIPILAVAWILGSIARRMIKPGGRASTEVPELTSIEAAYLAGGSRLALAALMTSLAQRKAVSFNARTRGVTVVAETVTSENYYGGRLYTRMGRDERTLESLEDDADQVFADLPERLKRLGLLVADDRRWIPQATILAIMGAALAVGVIKVAIGLSRGRPVSILLVVIGLGVVGLVKLLAHLPERSSLGDKVLKRLRHRSAGLEVSTAKRPERLAPNDLALAVALYGPAVISVGPVAVLAQALRPRPPERSGASSSHSRDCGTDSCGSSCGGGCGGGGCGGCSS
ncbi:MAG TPA: TIGR04222 domain-containing membrane protein [Gemmatimonadaceae bacterium]